MNLEPNSLESYEISPRFRRSIEERIARLERDAIADELALDKLDSEDHIRRHWRLIAIQRAEALRMRLFLDRATQHSSQPSVSH